MATKELLTSDEQNFENGVGGWAGFNGGSVVRGTVGQHSGSGCLAITPVAIGGGAQIGKTADAGATKLKCSGWLRGPVGTVVYVYVAAPGGTLYDIVTLAATDVWQYFTIEAQVAAGAVSLYFMNQSNTGLIYADDVSVQETYTNVIGGLTSTIPVAVDALVTKAKGVAAANPSWNITVGDGEAPITMGDNVYVIGYEVHGWKQDAAGLGNLRRHEEYAIQCLALSHNGGDGSYEASPVRLQVFQLIELLVQALTSDPTLGGAVRFAEVIGSDGGITRQGVSSIGGWSVEVEFGVRCMATLQQ